MSKKTDCERRSRVAKLPDAPRAPAWSSAVYRCELPFGRGHLRPELREAEPYVGGLQYLMARRDPLFGLKDNWPTLYEAVEALFDSGRLHGQSEYWQLAAWLLATGQTRPTLEEAERALDDIDAGRGFYDLAATLDQFRLEAADEGWSGEAGQDLRRDIDGELVRAPRLKCPHPALRKLHIKD